MANQKLESEFVEASKMPQYRDLVDDILELEPDLTSPDIEFLTLLTRWEGPFTKEQAKRINEIYEQFIEVL